jgi:hypothetical protein
MQGANTPPGIVSLPEAPTPPADCRPQIAAIFDHWQQMSPRGALPGRQHLDPANIVALLPNVWLLDVLQAPTSPLRWHFRYRLIGTEMVAVFGRDPTGLLLHEAWPRMAQPGGVYAHHVAVVEARRPSFRRGPTLYDGTRDHKWVERILLPLARDGEHVDMVLGLTLYLKVPHVGT